MGHYYFDSSALVKRYVAEAGTNWMNRLCAAGAGHTLYTVRISGAEIIAALCFCERERVRWLCLMLKLLRRDSKLTFATVTRS